MEQKVVLWFVWVTKLWVSVPHPFFVMSCYHVSNQTLNNYVFAIQLLIF